MKTELELVKELTILSNTHLEDLYKLSIETVAEYPELEEQLNEAHRRLHLAIKRELMDEYQANLAYRVTVKNLVKELQESVEK